MITLPSVLLAIALPLATPSLATQSLASPSGITLDANERVVVADRRAHFVFRVDPLTGAISPIAGTGIAGFSGDGGLATEAELRNPEWVEYDRSGNLFIADRGNHRVRRVDATTGIITTVVGSDEFESTGDGGRAVDADLTSPFGLTFDSSGNLFVFDTDAHVIRRVDATTGIIETVVGSGQRGFSGDGAAAIDALLARPHNGIFDVDGALVFGDTENQRIRRWTPWDGQIESIAGTGEEAPVPIGARADEASFTYFGAFVFEDDGSLVFTSLDHRIVRIDSNTGRLVLVAGTGVAGFSGDGELATSAQLRTPYGLAITESGDLYFSDAGNRRIRHIDADTGIITTVAGGS